MSRRAPLCAGSRTGASSSPPAPPPFAPFSSPSSSSLSRLRSLALSSLSPSLLLSLTSLPSVTSSSSCWVASPSSFLSSPVHTPYEAAFDAQPLGVDAPSLGLLPPVTGRGLCLVGLSPSAISINSSGMCRVLHLPPGSVRCSCRPC